MQFDRDKVVLFGLKSVSYIINAVIIAVVVGVVFWFIGNLFDAGTARPQRTGSPQTQG